MNLKININRKELIIIVIALMVGLLFGWLFFYSSGNDEMAGKTETQVEDHSGHDHAQDAATIWTCSMHPQIKMNNPGDCPICGMDLIPLEQTDSYDGTAYANELQMTDAAIKIADIQTSVVKKAYPEKEIHLLGKVQADERKISELTARFGGRIEKLFVNYTGQEISKGQKLATIYSPELVTAQRELLEAVVYKESNPDMYQAARSKLKLWDLTNEQIDDIEKKDDPQNYFEVELPISGIVTERNVSVGDYVKEGETLLTAVDLSHVWVLFEAYESDLPWINIGDKVNFSIQSLPGKDFSNNITFIDRIINPKTRIAKVRVELNNPGLKLKPEMFADGLVISKFAENKKQLLIPKTAILWTGKRSVVYVKHARNDNITFEYREIDLGPVAGDYYVVNSGIKEGEEVATNGVFKIDASAQLAGKPSMMNPGEGETSTGHNHEHQPNEQGNMNNANKAESYEDMHVSKTEISAPDKFIKQLTAVYNAYLEMKDAFVETKADKVSSKAALMAKTLKKVNMELLKGDAHMVWMKYLKKLDNALNTIQKSSDIEKQRQAFVLFNETFYKTIKDFGIENTTAYYQYCPMANGDKGAYWFSNDKEIRNPYFGDAMMTCGENREIIK